MSVFWTMLRLRCLSYTRLFHSVKTARMVGRVNARRDGVRVAAARNGLSFCTEQPTPKQCTS
jgi:hypothetical protein